MHLANKIKMFYISKNCPKSRHLIIFKAQKNDFKKKMGKEPK